MKLSLRHLVGRSSDETPFSLSLPILSAGLTAGLCMLVIEIAFGTFIFSGALAPYSSQGIGLILFGNFAACLLVAIVGGYRGTIAGLSPLLVPVMATIAATMKADAQVLFVTTACALIISAVAAGMCCFLVGRFRLANLLRFIPYPVAGGFVAGIGGVVCLAALSLMGVNLDWRAVASLELSALWTWLPGVAYGVILYSAIRRWGNPLILPVSILLAIAAYHLALSALGISGAEARAEGLLLVSTAKGNLWPVLWPADFAHVDWSAVAGQIPSMILLILIVLICVIVDIAGLEVAVGEDMDWNREFQATGLASIVGGLGGGTAASIIVSASLRSKLFHATARMTGVIAACFVGVALLFGDEMLELVPTAFVGGILVFAGLIMLDQGLVKSRERLPAAEYAIILLIFVVILFFGLIEGAGVGMVAILVFFTVRLSRVDTITSHFTARERRSNKTRSVPDRAIILAEGDRVQAYQLQGHIFFGSANTLVDRLRKALDGPSRPACLMIDFSDVSGFDFSAVNVVARFVQQANVAGVQVVLSGLSEKLRFSLENNIAPSVFEELWLESNADHGLERCEDFIIAAWNTDAATMERHVSLLEHTVDDLERYLERRVRFEDLMETLWPWLVLKSYSAEDVIAGPDVPSEGLQLLLSGHASVYDSAGLRLRQCGPSDVIWPSNPAGDMETTVVADESCSIMLLTPNAQAWVEKHEQGLAIELYRYMFAEHFRTETEENTPAEEGSGD